MKKILLSVIVAVMSIFAFAACGSKSLSPADYYTVSFSGYNGYGTASISGESDFGYAVLDALMEAKKIESSSWSDFAAKLLEDKDLIALSNTIESDSFVKLDTSSGLKNGDTVTLKFNYNNDDYKGAGIAFSGDSATFTVTGLKEIEDYDAFGDITVKYTGYSEYGTASVINETNNGLTYSVSSSENLKNGDTVTVEVSWGGSLEEYAHKYGKRVVSTTKEYTVSGLKEIEDFDAFENVDLVYSGIAPFGTAEISASGADGLYYIIDKTENLKNGDTITVTLSTKENKIIKNFSEYTKSNGKRPESITKEFTVDGLAEYISSPEQITDEAWDEIKSEMGDQKSAYLDVYKTAWGLRFRDVHEYLPQAGGGYWDNGAKFAGELPPEAKTNFEWKSAVLLYLKDGADAEGTQDWQPLINRLYAVYSCDTEEIKMDWEVDGNYQYIEGVEGNYGAFYIDNLIKNVDGTITYIVVDDSYTDAYKGRDSFDSSYINPYVKNYSSSEMELAW